MHPQSFAGYKIAGTNVFLSCIAPLLCSPGVRGAFSSMTLQIYFWGQLQLVMILDKKWDRGSPAMVILGAHMLDVARLLR